MIDLCLLAACLYVAFRIGFEVGYRNGADRATRKAIVAMLNYAEGLTLAKADTIPEGDAGVEVAKRMLKEGEWN